MVTHGSFPGLSVRGVCSVQGEQDQARGWVDALSLSSSARSVVQLCGVRFPPDVITLAVRWYLRYGLSYRDVEQLLASGASPWTASASSVVCDALRRCWWRPHVRADTGRGSLVGGRNLRQSVWSLSLCLRGDRSVRAGYRCVCVFAVRSAAARCFFTRALITTEVVPVELTTDKAAVYPRVVDELAPGAGRWTEADANNRMEAFGDDLLQVNKWSLLLNPEIVVDVHLLTEWATRLVEWTALSADLAVSPFCPDALELLPGWYDDWALMERKRLRNGRRMRWRLLAYYIDNGPTVFTHGRALLATNHFVYFGAADIFNPEKVLSDEIVRRYLIFSKPAALFQVGTLHHYDGQRSPQKNGCIHRRAAVGLLRRTHSLP